MLKWTQIQDMKNGRWYPDCITLSDGRILVMAGLSKSFPWTFLKELEIYSEDTDGWQPIPGADRWIPMYPRLHLLPSGEVFMLGLTIRIIPSHFRCMDSRVQPLISIAGNGQKLVTLIM